MTEFTLSEEGKKQLEEWKAKKKIEDPEGYQHWIGKFEDEHAQWEETIKISFKEIYLKIIKIIKRYCDIKEENTKIISLWIIGTYFHKGFNTYPYLFFNAMKGSGKSRLLNLISNLAWNGSVLVSMSEAVLFRTASQRTFCIDEFESVASKENMFLRELLNIAYKKGGKVERAKKIKTLGEEGYKIESFDVYCPIAMANIWGMDNVLADRCINLILDKSNNPAFTKKIEDFDTNEDISKVKHTLNFIYDNNNSNNSKFSVGSVVYVAPTGYNTYVERAYPIPELTYTTYIPYITNTTYTTNTSNRKKDKNEEFYEKIIKLEMEGRPLELFFPIFNIANVCGVLDEILVIAKEIVKKRKAEDIVENRDIILLDYIANQLEETNLFITQKDITNHLKEDEKDWINNEWVGRALKRLNIIIERRRVSKGMEVRLNFAKAREKIKILKPDIEIKEKENIKQSKEIPFKEFIIQTKNELHKCESCDLNVNNEGWNEQKRTCVFCNPKEQYR